MNKKANKLKLKNTHFVTPHGLDTEGHYTTAYELALIADYALKINKISEVVNTKKYKVKINNNYKTITNTNELLGYLNGVNGVKTGFTNEAGRCLVTSVNRDGFNIITVVLGADTKKMRTEDSIKLIEYIYSNYELVDIEPVIKIAFDEWKKINQKRIYVYKGKKNNTSIKLDTLKYKLYPVKKDKINDIKINIKNIKMFLEAPIYKDTIVAKILVEIDKKEIISIDIITNELIERKNIIDYIKEYIKKAI